MVAGIVVFAGCASVRFSSTFDVSGTATHTLEVRVPREGLTEQDLARVERQLADAELNARSGGLTTVRIDNPETIGIRVINETNDAADAGLALNSIFNTLAADPTTGPVAPFQGTFERVSEAVGGNSFEVNMTVNGDLLYRAAATAAPGLPQFSTPEGVREAVQIEYLVTMPGEITETNGGLRGDSSVVWTIPLDGPTQLYARSTVGKRTPWLWTIVAIVGALAIVATTAAIVWKLLIARQRSGRPIRRLTLGARRTGTTTPAAPLTTLHEVRASLIALLRRVVRGERLSPRREPPIMPAHGTEEPSRGADAQGD